MNFPFRSLAGLCLAATVAACATRASYVDLYGSTAPPSTEQPTIVIGPRTRYINVEGGQTVRFLVDGKSFAWTFNVAKTVHGFDLKEVAPPGMLDHSVIAMVSPDPKYIGF